MAAGSNPEYQDLPGGADSILPLLAHRIMPVGLGGLFLAALVAASNSTASSYLNSRKEQRIWWGDWVNPLTLHDKGPDTASVITGLDKDGQVVL